MVPADRPRVQILRVSLHLTSPSFPNLLQSFIHGAEIPPETSEALKLREKRAGFLKASDRNPRKGGSGGSVPTPAG